MALLYKVPKNTLGYANSIGVNRSLPLPICGADVARGVFSRNRLRPPLRARLTSKNLRIARRP